MLLRAIHVQELEIVKLLCRYGAMAEESMLSSAVRADYLEISRELLEHVINIRTMGRPLGRALFHAVENKYLKISKLLMVSRAHVNAMPLDKATPLHVAAKTKALRFTELLLQRGANLNVKEEQGYASDRSGGT